MLYYLFKNWSGGAHYAYENPLFRATCAALFCFLLTLWIGPKVIRQLTRLNLGDRPEFDHAELNRLTAAKADVPTMGGVMIIVSIAAGVLLFADPLNYYVQMGLACMVYLGLVGAFDDWMKLKAAAGSGTRDGLRYYEKLAFQVGLALVLGYFIFRHGQRNCAVIGPGEDSIEAYRVLMVPFYKKGIFLGSVGFMVITVLVVAGTSNAVNLTDGMDGLAGGCTAICCVVFMILAISAGTPEIASKLLIPYIPQSAELAVISGCMLGSCCGFLWYNCHPAQVFMGDTGSLPLGGLIGYMAIVVRQELMLLLVGGVFVIEALSVILQVGYFKLSGGKRLFRVAPIHHHFQVAGWSESQTVIRFWLVGLMFAVFALATVKLR